MQAVGFALAVICMTSPLKAQEISVTPSTFNLRITGIEKEEGDIRIAMFDSENTYLEKAGPVYAVVLPVKGDTCAWSPESLPPGKYAIAVYHDRNKNGELDTNILGIPKENYGFSNNARGRFGPASWEDASFTISKGANSMEIEIR